MTGPRLLWPCLILLSAPVAAEEPASPLSPGRTIEQRIEQSIDAAATLYDEPDLRLSLDMSLGIEATPSAGMDASLADPANSGGLQTTLAPIGIEQRIDKGLTAAGEESAFPADYAYGAFQRGWFLTAFSLALERAEKNDAAAQTLLGVLLSRGLGVKKDLAAAADWYGLAAKSGNPEALYALARLHLDGSGTERDTAHAADLLQQAADKGHAVASRELGYLLLQGSGREKNAMLAAAYFRRAARFGDIEAQYTLAGLYVEGVGVVANEKQAARWFETAARNGHTGAQVEFALLLFNGRGVPKDEAAGASWLRHAANADNPVAQLRLARVLAEGVGLDADAAAAARWYLIARERGLEDEFMENRLARLDPEALQSATAAAAEWARSRRTWKQASAPVEAGAQVDNSLE